jgi:hypothetical protein
VSDKETRDVRGRVMVKIVTGFSLTWVSFLFDAFSKTTPIKSNKKKKPHCLVSSGVLRGVTLR